MAKSIGLYGGSFDPIHFGHINLAIEMIEQAGLDEVWFCPANVNPHKADLLPISAEDRLAMLLLGLEGIPQCSILHAELLRPSPSYTIDTIRELLASEKENPQDLQFYLLLGEDAALGFPRWREAAQIIQLVPLLIAARSSRPKESQTSDLVFGKAFDKGRVVTRRMDVSSSEIRQRLTLGKCCHHLLPQKVLDYIRARRLYSILS